MLVVVVGRAVEQLRLSLFVIIFLVVSNKM